MLSLLLLNYLALCDLLFAPALMRLTAASKYLLQPIFFFSGCFWVTCSSNAWRSNVLAGNMVLTTQEVTIEEVAIARAGHVSEGARS